MKMKTLLIKRIAISFILAFGCWTSAAQFCLRPIITVQPVSSSVCVGGVALFAVVAVGTNLSYQWQVNSGIGFVNCDNDDTYIGVKTATLRVSGSATQGGNKYRCVVSNSCGSAVSNLCILTVPILSTIATPAIICNGASASLSVSGGLNYLWSTGSTAPNITVSPGQTTTYTVSGTTILGCNSSSSVTVTVNPSPNVTVIASPPIICSGSSSVLTASGADSYQWSTGETGPSITVTPAATTTYSVTGTNSLGCSKTVSTTVMVNPLPDITIQASPPSICAGAYSVLTASGATSYQWSTGETGASISVSPATTQSYSVVGTNEFGCSSTASVEVTVSPSPNVAAIATPSEICAGESSTLTASGASGYVWSSGENGPSITVSPDKTTHYQVSGTNDYGCSNTAVATVSVNPLPIISVVASNPGICPGGFTFLTASGASNYLWSTGETGSSIGVSPPETITYLITGTDDKGCTGSVFFTLEIGPILTINASATEICLGEHAFLTANGATNYEWSTGETIPNIGVQPGQTTTYSVTGSNDNGCTDVASVTITVLDCFSSAGRKPSQENEGELAEITVYPNPTNGMLHINGVPQDAIAEVYNSTGERVMISRVDTGSEINLTQYSKGTYFIRIRHQGASIYRSRIIKE